MTMGVVSICIGRGWGRVLIMKLSENIDLRYGKRVGPT